MLTLKGGDSLITQRQNDILSIIVELFSQTHEPVGSKALQDVIATSSATIRNDMARLEKLGFLEKAHTSSGRKPSLAGFKYFAEQSLNCERIDEQDAYQVVRAFDFEAFKLEDLLAKAATILADLTGFTGVVLDVEPQRQCLTGFEIVKLSAHDALAVLTLDESKSVTVQFAIPKHFLPKDLVVLKSLVLDRLVGQSVLEIHYKLRTEIPQIIQRYFKITDNVLDLFDYIFSALFQETVFVSGKVRSLDYASFDTYQFLDNEQDIAMCIRRLLTEEEQLSIQIAESDEAALSKTTVISRKFLIPYRGFGMMTLIGPVEMDYRRNVSLIHLVSKVLTAKLADYYRYLNRNHYEVNY